MKSIAITNEADVIAPICDPLRVPVDPFGNVTVTVRPETKLLPLTVTFWLPAMATGDDGNIEEITGTAPCTPKPKLFD